MALPVLPLIFTSAVFALCVCQVPSFNVPSERCVAPTLDYNALTTAGTEALVYIYSMSPFTSSCSGRVVGYWFCYQNPSSTTGERVNISTVLLLEDMGADYTIVRRFTVEAIPGRDCLSGGQCCVSRNLSAENQFGANSSYHYGVVNLPGGPDMRQTNVGSIGRPGYLLTTAEYTQSGDTLRRSGSPTLQPLTIFQFIIDNSTSDATTPTTSTDALPPTDTPSTGATPPTDTPSTPHTVTTHTDDISSLPPTLTTPTSNTDATFSNLPPSSPSASSTQQSTDVQTGLPVSTIIILSTVIPSTLVLLMIVCTVVVIIMIVRWRISARKQVDTAHEHIGSTELNMSASHKTALEHFEMNTNDAYGTNTAEVATTENIAYMTTRDTIPATQNVAYGQMAPGTDDCYDYVV